MLPEQEDDRRVEDVAQLVEDHVVPGSHQEHGIAEGVASPDTDLRQDTEFAGGRLVRAVAGARAADVQAQPEGVHGRPVVDADVPAEHEGRSTGEPPAADVGLKGQGDVGRHVDLELELSQHATDDLVTGALGALVAVAIHHGGSAEPEAEQIHLRVRGRQQRHALLVGEAVARRVRGRQHVLLARRIRGRSVVRLGLGKGGAAGGEGEGGGQGQGGHTDDRHQSLQCPVSQGAIGVSVSVSFSISILDSSPPR